MRLLCIFCLPYVLQLGLLLSGLLALPAELHEIGSQSYVQTKATLISSRAEIQESEEFGESIRKWAVNVQLLRSGLSDILCKYTRDIPPFPFLIIVWDTSDTWLSNRVLRL